MIEFVAEHYMWIVYIIIFAYCIWNGFKIELSIGNRLYFSYEIYELKRIMRWF